MMKKLFTKSSYRWIELRVMQIVLVAIAIDSYVKCNSLGNEYRKAGGLEFKDVGFDYEVVDTSITSGFTGGSLGFAIICATCLVLIVVLQKSHNKQEA